MTIVKLAATLEPVSWKTAEVTVHPTKTENVQNPYEHPIPNPSSSHARRRDSPTSIPKLLVKNNFLLPIFSTNMPAVKAIPKLKICKIPLIKVLVPAASIPTVSKMMLM